MLQSHVEEFRIDEVNAAFLLQIVSLGTQVVGLRELLMADGEGIHHEDGLPHFGLFQKGRSLGGTSALMMK